jgi:hypothetical protein
MKAAYASSLRDASKLHEAVKKGLNYGAGKLSMQQPDQQESQPPVVPSAEFLRLINGLRESSPQTYNLVVAARVAVTKSPKFYLDQALELESHTDQLQVWVTVKGVRLLIRHQGSRLVLDHFVVRNQLT